MKVTYGVWDGRGGEWVYAGTTPDPGDGLRTIGVAGLSASEGA
jgi:hypothetical protein